MILPDDWRPTCIAHAVYVLETFVKDGGHIAKKEVPEDKLLQATIKSVQEQLILWKDADKLRYKEGLYLAASHAMDKVIEILAYVYAPIMVEMELTVAVQWPLKIDGPISKGNRVRLREEWHEGGKTGVALGGPVKPTQLSNVWVPVIWDGNEDPEFYKEAGLERIT